MKMAFLSVLILICLILHQSDRTSAWFFLKSHSRCQGPPRVKTWTLLLLPYGRRGYHLVSSLLKEPLVQKYLRLWSVLPDHRGKPYYFGTTDLLCKIGRRSAPSRFTLSVSHRWILFDGEYFEWGVHGQSYYYGNTLTDGDHCHTEREADPAGYSQLDRSCIEKCARSYKGRYGAYNLLTNNCHDFANKLSEVLCNHTTCPEWCQ